MYLSVWPVFKSFLEKSNYKVGYRVSPLKSIIRIVANKIIAALLLLLHLPLFIIVGGIIFWKLGTPILYKGSRIGRNKKLFTMYKFRTLPLGTQKKLGAVLLSSKHNITDSFIQSIRDIRLDEMPQLFNIFNGDMDFIGPRPIRPELYEVIVKDKTLKNYDCRFSVFPGLVGYAQLFTPHSTPKRIRSLIDSKLVSRKHSIIMEWMMLFYTAILFLRKLLPFLSYDFILKEIFSKEILLKKNIKNVSMFIWGYEQEFFLKDIKDNILFLELPCTFVQQIGVGEFSCIIRTVSMRSGKQRYKNIYCTGFISKYENKHNDSISVIIDYEALSVFNQYLLDQYVLKKSYA